MKTRQHSSIIQLLSLSVIIILGSLAFSKKSAYPTVSVEVKKMNILYIGMDNPIIVAVANVPVEEVKLKSTQIKIEDKGNGHFNLRPTKVGTQVLEVIVDGFVKEEKHFRVKRIPDPIAKIGSRTGGKMDDDIFKAQKGLRAVIENFDIDASCKILSYNLTYVSKGADPVASVNKGGAFTAKTRSLVNKAKQDDIYYIDEVICTCPGDANQERPINSLVFKIEE